MRPIDPRALGAFRRPETVGLRALQAVLPIAALRVDPLYQREITGGGRRNARGIAEAFDWDKFAPVIVAALPLDEGADAGPQLYAIVDGQHRTTAAAALGFDSVPCLIIRADRGGQARAFRAINAQTTQVSAAQLFKAALASQEPDALLVARLCEAAGVRVLVHATSFRQMKAGDTLSVEALYRLSRERRGLALAVLRGVRAQARDGVNLLRAVVLDALRLVLAEHEGWWRDEPRFIAALTLLDLEEEWRNAMATKARHSGLSAVDALYARLTTKLLPLMQAKASAGEAA